MSGRNIITKIALGVAAAAFIFSLITRKPEQEVLDEFDHYMDEGVATEERSLDGVLEGPTPL